MTRIATALAAFALATPALAEGDIAKGEKEFGKCKACHTVEAADGTVIVKGGKTGPNLYGVIGRAAGSTDFKYGPGLKEAGEKGLVWDAETFEKYVEDPSKFIKEYTGDNAVKSNMTFKLKKGGEDIAAWLVSVSAN
ncbi:c-type cytochrome [Gemmobacter nectariphilus]|uniref:c-type cytochrome n=1 Tax=Gemmobacter nectariphilus TaxID=220343 RepID=UPI00047F7481|nr:cytochrome c550 [Gemmobacter nectariphilus]